MHRISYIRLSQEMYADWLSVLANTYFDEQPEVQPSSDPVSGTSQNAPSGITRLLNASRSLTVALPVSSSLGSNCIYLEVDATYTCTICFMQVESYDWCPYGCTMSP